MFSQKRKYYVASLKYTEDLSKMTFIALILCMVIETPFDIYWLRKFEMNYRNEYLIAGKPLPFFTGFFSIRFVLYLFSPNSKRLIDGGLNRYFIFVKVMTIVKLILIVSLVYNYLNFSAS